MAYTPELDKQGSQILRRVAWAVGAPMTATLKQIILTVPKLLERLDICKNCKDHSICTSCIFNEEQAQDFFHLALMIKDKKLSVREVPVIIHKANKPVPVPVPVPETVTQ